jgi:hypothetical protein
MPRTPIKVTVDGPRLLPVLAPQPLPMLMEKWFEEERARDAVAG